jgi:glycosyltransferase involved in cell wall biosynthesis
MVFMPGSTVEQISVVIPTFNRSSFLPKALESVYKQTLPPLEVIVVDDGSTDSTKSKLSPDYPKVKWIKQKNHGVSFARNQGINKALGNWIAFLDSDDTWSPNKLEQQKQFLERNPDLLFCHTDEQWLRHNKLVNQPAYLEKSNQDIFLKSLTRCIICPSSVIIHKSLLHSVGMFDETFEVCEDYDLWLRILVQNKIGYLPQKLVSKHGGHDDQLSAKHWGMDRFRVRSLKNLLNQAELSTWQRISVIETLIEKLKILAQGFAKHGKLLQSQEFKEEIQVLSKQVSLYSTKHQVN